MMIASRHTMIAFLAAMALMALIGESNAKPPARIVGGQDAQSGEYKWMVALSRGMSSIHCGGAIISPRHILTAAHCLEKVRAKGLAIRSGIVDLDDESDVISKVARLVMHPGYLPRIPNERDDWQNDIGIVVLKKPLELGGRLSAIPVATRQPGRQRATLSGWGNTSDSPLREPTILQTAEVQVINDEDCQEIGINSGMPQFFHGIHKNGNILAGDSGSPLVSDGELIGVASWTYGVIGSPDAFANVYYYRNWINSVVNQTLN